MQQTLDCSVLWAGLLPLPYVPRGSAALCVCGGGGGGLRACVRACVCVCVTADTATLGFGHCPRIQSAAAID